MVSTVSIPFKDDLLQEVDVLARGESTSREELINGVIERYVRLKEFERVSAACRAWAEKTGLTEEDINEEIRLCREEEKARSKR